MPKEADFEYRLNLRNIMYLLYGSKEKTALFLKPRGKQTPVDIAAIKSKREQFLKIHLGLNFNVITNDELYALFKGDTQHGGNNVRSDFVKQIEENDEKNNGNSRQIQIIINRNREILNKWIYNGELFLKTFLNFINRIDPDFLEKELRALIVHYLQNNEPASALSWLLIAALLQEKFIKELRRYYLNVQSRDSMHRSLAAGNTDFCIQPFTADTFNPYGNTFVLRPDLLNKIEALYKSGEKAVFLSGMGGIGKSELARSYAYQQRMYFSKIVWLVCEDGKKPDLEELLNCNNTGLSIKNLEAFPCNSLIIVDNYNTESREFMKRLLCKTGKSRLLFTTRKIKLYGSKNNLLPVISSHPEDFAYAVFQSNYCAESLLGHYKKIQKDEETSVLKICKSAGYHTMTIAMIAMELREYDDCTIEMFAEKLNKGLKKAVPDGALIPFHKDENDETEDERNLLEILKILFSDLLHHTFSQEERELLSILSLIPAVEIERKYLCELLGDNEYQKYMESGSRILIKAGWIKYSDGKVSIHPLISEVLKLEQTSEILIHDSGFYRHILANWLVMDPEKQLQAIFLIQKIKESSQAENKNPNLYLAIQYSQNISQARKLFMDKYPGCGIACHVDCHHGRIFVYHRYPIPATDRDLIFDSQKCARGQDCIYLDLSTRKSVHRYWKIPEENRSFENIQETAALSFLICETETAKLKLPDYILDARVTLLSTWFAAYNQNLNGIELPCYLEKIGKRAFEHCTSLTYGFHLPETLKIIGESAFHGCTALIGDLEFPENLQRIEGSAFAGCSGFHGELIFPESLDYIGEAAFSGCSGFCGELKLPQKLKYILQGTFKNCRSLHGTLKFPENLLEIGDYAFEFCNSLYGNLHFPKSLVKIGASAFQGCSKLDGTVILLPGLKEIGQSAFENCSRLHGSLVLPDGLQAIGAFCFRGCCGFNGSLNLPKTLDTIGEEAFRNCSGFFGNLRLPQKLEIIPRFAFKSCYGFQGRLILPENLKLICKSAFEDCSGFCGKLQLPDSLIKIEKSAFENCSGFQGELKLPDKVQEIGEWAFSNCSGLYGELVFPENSIKIGRYAFQGCPSITENVSGQTEPEYQTIIYYNEKGELEFLPGTTSIREYAFKGNEELQGKINLPSELISIGAYAFKGCIRLTGDLRIPEKVTVISLSAFSDCSGFCGNLFLPEKLHEIGIAAFANCSGFNGELILPKDLKIIGNSAFKNCSGFTGNLKLPQGLEYIGDKAFSGCSGFSGELQLPEGLKKIGAAAFENCCGFTGNLKLPEGIKSIGDRAFEGCSGLTKLCESADFTKSNDISPENGSKGNYAVPLPSEKDSCCLFLSEGTVSIENFAFLNNTGFTGNLILPDSLKHIGDFAFKGCSGFTGKLSLTSNIETIGRFAFKDCSGFYGILKLPEKLKSLGTCAFKNCTGFTGKLEFPKSITVIEEASFFGCAGLTEIFIPASVQTIEHCAFSFCTQVKTITVANPYTEINGWITEGYIPTLRGKRNSTTEEYARRWKLPFEYME